MVQTKQVNPFFSIITCTKNSAKFINKCLDSIRGQSFLDYEHIIVDGESTDGTLKIISKYNLKVVTTKPVGIANAMNKGLALAKGRYIYFLNSDDSFYGDSVLQDVHDYLVSHPDLDWVFGNIHETDGKRTIGFPPKRKIFQGKHPNLLNYYNYIPHQATFIKKTVFEKFGFFDESLKSMMDPEYWLRIKDATEWGYLPVTVANYLIRPDSQSENLNFAQSNTKEYETVQSRYLSKLELMLAKIINKKLR